MSVAQSTAFIDRNRLGLPVAALVVGVMAAAVWFAFRSMMTIWAGDEYSYAWLIIPLAVLLVVHRFPLVARSGGRWLGLGLAALSLAMMVFGWATQIVSVSIYGWILGIASLVWASLGSQGIRGLAAPIAFLCFMIPLPLAFYITVSSQMQLLSSKLGVGLLALIGVPVSLDGNMIDLSNGRLEVAQACNGLRYLFPLLSMAFMIGVLMDGRRWAKAIVVLSALPIAVLVNSLRLGTTGFMVDRWGMDYARGLPHEILGLVGFALCIGVLACVVMILGRFGQGTQLAPFDVLLPRRAAIQAVIRWPSPRPFLAASLLLAVGAGIVAALPKPEVVIPDRRPLALFPMTIGSWLGNPAALDSDTLGALGLTDYVMADYADPANAAKPINFYVAYYASQRFGQQIHSPRLCIPGGGWSFAEESLVEVPLADGSRFTAKRAVIEKRGARQIVYYWFQERGRRMTEELQVKWAAIADSLLSSRSDGGLVRLVTPVGDGTDEEADERLRVFASMATADLRRYVPD